MPIPYTPQREIAIDFVVVLPLSTSFKGVTYENILTVTHRLTKQKYYIPAKSITARNTVRLFIRYVQLYYKLIDFIISDRGLQFVSKFQSKLYSILGIERRLLLAFHLETDGQSQNTNQFIEQYLRIFINYAQNDQVEQLPIAEFTYNNYMSESIGVTLFYANLSLYPRSYPDEVTSNRT